MLAAGVRRGQDKGRRLGCTGAAQSLAASGLAMPARCIAGTFMVGTVEDCVCREIPDVRTAVAEAGTTQTLCGPHSTRLTSRSVTLAVVAPNQVLTLFDGGFLIRIGLRFHVVVFTLMAVAERNVAFIRVI